MRRWPGLSKPSARPVCAQSSTPGNCLYDPLGETPYPDGYEAIRPFFAHVHIKDAVRAVPESYCVKVGTGQVGYPALLRRLAADGYAAGCPWRPITVWIPT